MGTYLKKKAFPLLALSVVVVSVSMFFISLIRCEFSNNFGFGPTFTVNNLVGNELCAAQFVDIVTRR